MQNINLIGIAGRAGSGKNTVAAMIQKITNSGWQQKAFAGKLKQIASILTGIPVEKFEDQEFKKSMLGEEWCVTENIRVGENKYIPRPCPMTIREFLQKLGTDGLRDGLHENVWVNALFADYVINYTQEYDQVIERGVPDYHGPVIPGRITNNSSKWIITDTRFPNELQAVKDRGGLTIRLTRNSDVRSDHISETALDNAEFDYVIDNKDQTLEETFESVKEMIDKF